MKGGAKVEDEIELTYQTEVWGEPSKLSVKEKARKGDVVTVEAKLFDASGILCLDSAKTIRFSLTGTGNLVDNLGTVRASRELQLSNGRAEISVFCKGGCTITATPEGVPAASLHL